jgi:hypothetical protein
MNTRILIYGQPARAGAHVLYSCIITPFGFFHKHMFELSYLCPPSLDDYTAWVFRCGCRIVRIMLQ